MLYEREVNLLMKNRIVAITMVKNEADIIESFVRHTLLFADALIIANHRSTDGTLHILEELMKEGLALRVQNLTEEGHAQSKTMTQLMYFAIEEEKADIVVALDADEFLLSESAGSDETRDVLQSLDSCKVYHVPWVDYAPMDMTSSNDAFILSRICCRAKNPDMLSKVIVGRKAALRWQLEIVQGNHYAMPHEEQGRGFLCAFEHQRISQIHIAHFRWRSMEQRLLKEMCGWLSNVAQFSMNSFYARNWKCTFKDFLDGKTPEKDSFSIVDAIPADLGAYREECVLRYTDGRVDPVTNVLRMAELIADSYCREKVLSFHRIVSVLLVYDGNTEAFLASLQSIRQQTYPFFEIVVLNMGENLLSEAIQLSLEDDSKVRILQGEIFAQLPVVAKGDYIQWLLPGDLLEKEKIEEMVVVLETHPHTTMAFCAGYFPSTVSHASSFVPPHFELNAGEQMEFVIGRDLRDKLLWYGLNIATGLSGALFRRNTMEEVAWLLDCFIGSRPMLLTIWMKTLRDDGLNAIFADRLVHSCVPYWSADTYILYRMEWYYLLEKVMRQGILGEEDFKEAMGIFRESRLRIAKSIKTEASPELYEAYMSLDVLS